jgi:hypothetical protein
MRFAPTSHSFVTRNFLQLKTSSPIRAPVVREASQGSVMTNEHVGTGTRGGFWQRPSLSNFSHHKVK